MCVCSSTDDNQHHEHASGSAYMMQMEARQTQLCLLVFIAEKPTNELGPHQLLFIHTVGDGCVCDTCCTYHQEVKHMVTVNQID